MHMSKKKRVMISIFTFLIITFAITFSYAFFSSESRTDNLNLSLSTGTMHLTFLDGNGSINATMLLGDSIEKKFIIKNEGTLDSSLSLDWKNLINTYTHGSLSYSLYSSPEENGQLTEVYPETNIPTSTNGIDQTLCSEVNVPAGKTYYFTLKITFNDLDFDQSADFDAIFKTQFAAKDPSMYRYYKLNIDASGGNFKDDTSFKEELLKQGESYELEVPIRENYTFVGWSLKGSSSDLSENTFLMGSTDSYLTAIWSHETFDLNIDYDTPGVTNKTDKVAYMLPKYVKKPTREGYTFIGWESSDGNFDGDNFILTKEKTATIKAKWAKEYDYIINHRKMSVDGSTYNVEESEIGKSALNSTVSSNFKTYKGFTSPSEKKKMIIQEDDNPPVKNILNYDYVRNKYKVKFDLAGGIATTGEKYKVHYIDSETQETLFTRDFYTDINALPNIIAFRISGYIYNKATVNDSTKEYFLYYIKDETYNPTIELTIEIYDLETNEKLLSMPFTTVGEILETDMLRYIPDNYTYAGSYYVEEENKYYIYCEKNPDFVVSTASEKEVYYNSIVDLSHLTLEKPGYYLSSLTSDVDLDNYQFLMPDRDVTFTAKWKEATYAVQFISNGGYFNNNPSKTASTKIVKYNDTYGELPIPVYPGFIFSGWYTSLDGGTLITEDSIVEITKYQTLYAKWTSEISKDLETTLAKLNITEDILSKDEPDFTEVATGDEGIYALGDDYGMSYYYRGNVTNNYVVFGSLTKLYMGKTSNGIDIPVATLEECLDTSVYSSCGYVENLDMYWRILRVNGDGSIRLVYDGLSAAPNGTKDFYRNLFYSEWEDISNDNKYIGYKYGTSKGSASLTRAEAQTNTTNSLMKVRLDKFYEENLAKYGDYLADVSFCNNRITFSNGYSTGYGENDTFYTYSRLGLQRGKPVFRCFQKNDAFTVDDTSHGNGTLNYPIGLITADEIIAAGGLDANSEKENNKFYLYKGYEMWTMSPAFYANGIGAMMYTFDTALNFATTDSFIGVSPVINLKAEYVKNLLGNGNEATPYYLEEVNSKS